MNCDIGLKKVKNRLVRHLLTQFTVMLGLEPLQLPQSERAGHTLDSVAELTQRVGQSLAHTFTPTDRIENLCRHG